MPKVIEDTQIFRAVMITITKRGYAGATTRQIAETAGVSEVTLFRKYGSKSELVKQTINSLVEQSNFEFAPQYTGDILADLLRVLKAYREGVIENEYFFFVLSAELRHNPELANTFSQPLGLFKSIGQLLLRYQSDGILKNENPFHSVASLLGPLIFFSMSSQLYGDSTIPPMELDSYVQYYLDGRYKKIVEPTD